MTIKVIAGINRAFHRYLSMSNAILKKAITTIGTSNSITAAAIIVSDVGSKIVKLLERQS